MSVGAAPVLEPMFVSPISTTSSTPDLELDVPPPPRLPTTPPLTLQQAIPGWPQPMGAPLSVPFQLTSPSFLRVQSSAVIEKYRAQQNEFRKNLTGPERIAMRAYTHAGDRIVNQILRGNVTRSVLENPTFVKSVQEFKERYPGTFESAETGFIRKFIDVLFQVASKAPKTTDEIQVYRGVQRVEDLATHGNEFLSTSLSRDAAVRFIGEESCCLLNIMIKPGVRTMWLQPVSTYPAEEEIVICPPFKIEFTKSMLPKMARKYSGDYTVVISPVPVYRARGRTYRRKGLRKTNKRKNNRKTSKNGRT